MVQIIKNPKSLQRKIAILTVIIVLILTATIAVVVITKTLTANCGGTLPPPTPPPTIFEHTETPFSIINNVDGVTLEIKENSVSKNGVTIILKNATPQKYKFDGLPGVVVEEKINDKWYTISHIPSNRFDYAIWQDILDEHSTKEAGIWWSSWYGELKPGSYRILQPIQLYPGERWPNATPTPYLAAEFIID